MWTEELRMKVTYSKRTALLPQHPSHGCFQSGALIVMHSSSLCLKLTRKEDKCFTLKVTSSFQRFPCRALSGNFHLETLENVIANGKEMTEQRLWSPRDQQASLQSLDAFPGAFPAAPLFQKHTSPGFLGSSSAAV